MPRREELLKYPCKQLDHRHSIYKRVNFSCLPSVKRDKKMKIGTDVLVLLVMHPSCVASNRRRPGQLHNRHNYSQRYYKHRMHCNCHIGQSTQSHWYKCMILPQQQVQKLVPAGCQQQQCYEGRSYFSNNSCYVKSNWLV